MIIKNVKIFTEEKTFIDGGIVIFGEKIVEIYEGQKNFVEKDVIDGNGAYAIPGLIDIHLHGCKGYDFCDGTKEAIEEIAKYQASVGVTAIALATMTLPVEKLEQILSVAASYKKEQHKGADFIGINMEGPFISSNKKGAQNANYILPCDSSIAKRFIEVSENLVKWIGIAPEESENAIEFIKEMKQYVNIALAHTNASYECAKEAFVAGANHVVHLYNGMTSYTHREPGVVGAVADFRNITTELICDGVHIHPATVRSTFQMMGEERMILISDSMRATGMPNGRYTLGGLEVEVAGNRAVLVSNKALAGSVTNLMDCMKITVKEMKIPLEKAVACVTMNPAKALGVYNEYGSIKSGKIANIVLLDKELELKKVILKGKELFC